MGDIIKQLIDIVADMPLLGLELSLKKGKPTE